MDWNSAHIEKATKMFGSERVRFLCGDVVSNLDLQSQHFDLVFSFGLLHHLDDQQADRMLGAAAQLLAPGGRFMAIEPVYHYDQHPFAKWMKDHDSGQNIRQKEGYRKLLASHWMDVQTEVRTGMLRVPYSHCVITAARAVK